MAVFTSAYRQLAHGALNWDTQLDSDMFDLEQAFDQGSAYPGIGGGGGATLGANGFGDGTFFRVGKHTTIKGRLVFGSSASFGGGTATVNGLGITIDTAHSTGYGAFVPTSGSPVPVVFTPMDGANMVIRPVMGNGSAATYLGVGFNLGTPPQSSVLLFTLDLTGA